ncbi:MAG: acyltransferase family protein [Chitinophagia bacterium]
MQTNLNTSSRLLSLDFMRGMIMFLLALEAAGLYDVLYDASEGQWIHNVVQQFHHHPWNGLRFWDLIQPGFMFMAGIAMAYSVTGMKSKGFSAGQKTLRMFKRSGWLFFWGVLIYAVRKSGLSFELWNVLTQLSFTLLLAYFIFDLSIKMQIGISAGLLLLTEVLYRFIAVNGFDQPFTDQHNFGNYVDLLLMNKINKGGWVAINCIPTAAHTIAGAVVGKLLIDGKKDIIKWMLIAAGACLFMGYGLDLAGITPIIKRISTSSFALASLGWCLLCMAACYYWIDIKHRNKGLYFFKVIGMNSIFIYLFFEIPGGRWFNGYIEAITSGILSSFLPELAVAVIASITIFILEWKLCEFLYKRGIFFRL